MTDAGLHHQAPPAWHGQVPLEEGPVGKGRGEEPTAGRAAAPMPGLGWDEEPPSPPVNLEAEQALLAAVLTSNDVVDQIEDLVTAEHFADPVHARIFQACLELVAERRPANAVTLHNRFERDGGLKEVGGADYLAQLQSAYVLPFQAPHYAGLIRDLHRRRAVMEHCAEAYNRLGDLGATDEGGTETICNALAGGVDRVLAEDGAEEGLTEAGEAAQGWLRFLEDAKNDPGGLLGTPTGLIALDNKLRGLQAGRLYVIAGRPGMGKSALALTLAVNAARRGYPVAFFSLEMSREELAGRATALLSEVPLDKQTDARRMSEGEWAWVRRAIADVKKLPLKFDDGSGLSVAKIRARARRMKRQQGLGLVVVDYLQLMGGERERGMTRDEEIGRVTRALKRLALALEAPVALLSQLNRQVEARDDKRPRLSDLRESGSIEQDADVVLFPYRAHYYLKKEKPERRGNESADNYSKRLADWGALSSAAEGKAELIVAKNRNGPEGTLKTAFRDELTLFDNLPGDGQEEIAF